MGLEVWRRAMAGSELCRSTGGVWCVSELRCSPIPSAAAHDCHPTDEASAARGNTGTCHSTETHCCMCAPCMLADEAPEARGNPGAPSEHMDRWVVGRGANQEICRDRGLLETG